ncbi:hypothetical protein CDL60_22670 [Roseateles noduli]|nr:hypothetical protein CDL60_22670 [Roseateles noduli]
MTHPIKRGLTALLLAASILPVLSVLSATPARAADGSQARLELQDQMAALVRAGRFAEIVARSEIDLAQGTRLPDGSWRGYETFIAFEQPLYRLPVEDPLWGTLLPALRERSEARAGDVFLYVQALHARAWNVRGAGYSRTVSGQQQLSFRALMELARDALDRHRATLSDSPMWWAQRTTVANELGEGPKRLQALFEEGVRRFPDFHPIYLTRVRALTPKWGGSEDAMLDLLDTIAAMPEPAMKEGLYARATWVAENEGVPLFVDPRFKKDVWLASSAALVRQWPDTRNRRRHFLTACALSEKALAQSELPALDEPVLDKDLARSGQLPLLERCGRWARGSDGFLMGLQYRGKEQDLYIE